MEMSSVAFSEAGSCEEDDFDLFKAFLRDSDSDCEDAYYIQPSSRSSLDSADTKACSPKGGLSPLADGGKHDLGFGLTSPWCRANSNSLLDLSSKLDACTTPETGSPHSSQGHSSLTSFPSSVSELGSPSQEKDDQSFNSMLSMASTSTLFDLEIPDDSPDRKRKASWLVMGHPEKKASSPAGSVTSAATVEKSPTPPPALAAVKRCCTPVGKGMPAMGVAPGAFVGGSISTGVPIDTLAAQGPLPYAQSPPPPAYPAAWPTYLAPLPGKGMGAIPAPLQSPQAMIPTTIPAVTPYPTPARATPAPTAPTAVSTQKIAAALAEMSRLPVTVGAPGPLGLKLDRVGLINTLRGMGVKKLET